MSKILFLAPLVALAIVGCTSTGASSERSAAKGQVVKITPEIRASIKAQGHDPDEEICKKEEQMGSTIPKRICATRAVWAATTQASQDGTAEAQRRALSQQPEGN